MQCCHGILPAAGFSLVDKLTPISLLLRHLSSNQAKRDWFFIAMPNAMGVAFNTASLILCLILPAKDRQQQVADSDNKPNALRRMLAALKGGKVQQGDDAAASEVSEDSHEIDLAVEAVSQHHHNTK